MHNIYVDKRKLGDRLNPSDEFLSYEFDSLLLYDDIHLPRKQEDIIFRNETWPVLYKIFSHLFHQETIQLLSKYHYQTIAEILSKKNMTSRS